MAHAGVPCSNPGEAKVWRLVTLKPFKIQRCSLHFWKIPIFISMDTTCQISSCNLNSWKSLPNIARFVLVYLLAVCRLLHIVVLVLLMCLIPTRIGSVLAESFDQKGWLDSDRLAWKSSLFKEYPKWASFKQHSTKVKCSME